MSRPQVLIAAGCPHATVTRYRCLHLQEQLAANGIEAAVEEWYDPAPIGTEHPLPARALVLQRVPITGPIARLIQRARANGVAVVFDADDLVFEPGLTAWHRGVQNLTEADQRRYVDGVRRYLATLQASDAVMTASPLLAELAQRHGPRAFVHRNALGREMLALADRLYGLRRSRSTSDRIVMSYGSGTPTHDVDFEEAAPAVLDLLTRHPATELWIAGPMRLPAVFAAFGPRVRRFPLLDWRSWFELAAQADIALAPLEADNLFCRAKSEIKFVEAAAQGIPVVASRIDPFVAAMTHGVDGLLAATPAEWIDALEALVADAGLRRRMGEAGRSTVEARYTPAARAAELVRVWGEVAGGGRAETGDWRLETGDQRLETGDWRSEIRERRLGSEGVGVVAGGSSEYVEESTMAKKAKRSVAPVGDPRILPSGISVDSVSVDEKAMAGAAADTAPVADVASPVAEAETAGGSAPAQQRPATAVPLTINWLVTEPFPGSGGHTGIFRMIRHLVDFGHTCHVHTIPVNFMQKYTPAQIEQYVDTHFMRTGAIFHQGNGQAGPADATVATYWKTVPLLQQLPAPGRRYYLVQDFEPYFYPVGAEYIQAENTYRQGLHCLTLGPWLARLMREQYGAEADHFDFAVDTDVYSPIPAPRPAHLRVAFYARPSTPRRAYELGLEALKLLKARQPGVEVIFYGADKLAPPPPFSYSNMGILNPWELARLFSTCDVGLVFSTTNPSFVPFEMMACRCAVVDIRSDRVEGLLEDGINCRLADPTPASIADTLLDLLWNRQQREAIVETAFQQVKACAWRNSARQIEEVLLRHAPPPEQRVAWQAGKGDDADMLVWQIHQLLDAGAGKVALVDDLRAALYRTLAEKAALLEHMRQLEQGYNQQPPAAAGPRVRAAVQPLVDKLLENTPGWRQGNAPLSKLALRPAGFHQQFQADRSHLCRIELYFAPRQPIHTGTIRFALYADDASNRSDAPAAPRLVTAQTFFVVDLPLDRPLAIDCPVEDDAYGKRYTFTVAPGEVDQQSPGLWHFWQGQHPEARLVEGDHLLRGQLAFQPFFQEQGQWIGPRQGPPAWGEPVRLAPDVAREVVSRGVREANRLTTRARDAVQGQGIAGLGRELMHYMQWQLTKGSQG